VKKEYTIIVKHRTDLKSVEQDLVADTGKGAVPNRSVELKNPRYGSKVQTHFMLTDDEAESLRQDPRIRAIEIPPEQRQDIQIGINASQTGDFTRGFNSADDVNWGLRRIIETINVYGDTASVGGDYVYALNGAGVDIVIQDSGIQVGHPEWEDASGTTRLQQIDWYAESGIAGTQDPDHYRDRDGHGTHCAGIAAGKTYGFAKGARIYSQKLEGLETLDNGSDGTGIPLSDAFDTIRLWHNNKAGERPTVVNMSWGFTNSSTFNPNNGVYRGVSWDYNDESDTELWDLYGIVSKFNGNADPDFRRLPVQVASVDAEIEDMILDGIHICIAAGNDFYKADTPGGNDYDNFAIFDSNTIYYHRPGSPYAAGAYYVGNLDTNVILDGTYKDKTAPSSKKGPAVNIWAPGTGIMSTSSNLADASYTLYDYPGDSSFKIMNISGTSMSSPQIAGVLALHLESQPALIPSELANKIFADCQSVIYQTANNDTDYRQVDTSILGSPNRHVFDRYGVQPFQITSG
jgi:subtilisin family serine protease